MPVAHLAQAVEEAAAVLVRCPAFSLGLALFRKARGEIVLVALAFLVAAETVKRACPVPQQHLAVAKIEAVHHAARMPYQDQRRRWPLEALRRLTVSLRVKPARHIAQHFFGQGRQRPAMARRPRLERRTARLRQPRRITRSARQLRVPKPRCPVKHPGAIARVPQIIVIWPARLAGVVDGVEHVNGHAAASCRE